MFQHSYGQAAPAVPLTPDVVAFLKQQGYVIDKPDGLQIGKDRQVFAGRCILSCIVSTPVHLISKGASTVASATSGAVDYTLDAANTVVQTTGNVVTWTAGTLADGTRTVIEKVGDVTTYTIDLAADGTKMVIRNVQGVAYYTIENAIPSNISFNGTTYVDFDPVKKVAKAGIRIPLNIVKSGTTLTADGLKYLNGKAIDGAVSTVNVVEGVTYLMVDLATFTSSNTTDIAKSLAKGDMDEAIKKTINTVYSALTNILNWGDLGWCGSMNSASNSVLTNVLVPDYWPPDEQLLNLAEGWSSTVCRPRGLARLYKGCRTHDYCYSIPGKTKADCDNEIKLDWWKACDDAYGDGYCRSACRASTELYNTVLRNAGDGPFKDAQAKSAADASVREWNITKYNESKAAFSSNVYPMVTTTKPASYVPQPFVYLVTDVTTKYIRVVLMD